MTKYLLVCVSLAVSFASSGHTTAPPKPCKLYVDRVDRNGTKVTLFGDNSTWDAAGNVRMHCLQQQVFIETDSISVLTGNYVRLFGHAVYRDTAYRITADTMYYQVHTELIQARGHVHVLDKLSGSTLVGPYVDYYRQVKGINDSVRVVSLDHPTVRYFTATVPVDTVHQRPYILTGRTLRGFGQAHLLGNDDVTIDRDSLHGVGDSLDFTRSASSIGYLYGSPARLRRVGRDSLLMLGKKIRVGFKDDQIHQLFAYLDARVKRGESDVAGDTVRLDFVADKVALTLAWAHGKSATLYSQGFDIRGDSLAVDTPDEQLREIRAFRQGIILSPLDTSHRKPPAGPDSGSVRSPAVSGDSSNAPDPLARNFVSGNRVVTASFAQVDSGGGSVTHLTGIVAVGKASSLFTRWGMKDGKQTQSTNYTTADTINIVMRTDSAGVQLVNARGHVSGMQADSNEAAFVHKTSPADSTKPTPTGKP